MDSLKAVKILKDNYHTLRDEELIACIEKDLEKYKALKIFLQDIVREIKDVINNDK